MKRLRDIVASAFAAVGMGRETPTSMPTSPGPEPNSAERPWERAQAIIRATEADLSKGGIRTIGMHVADLEDSLAAANQGLEAARASGYVLTDGQAETVTALQLANAGGAGMPGRQVVAVANPYPSTAFYLGTYYNAIGRPAEALRVLDNGLALPTSIPRWDGGESRALLITERGVALFLLRRWEDGLANYNSGLTIDSLDSSMRATMLRGRGFALIELGRLDEAEKAYRDSLVSEPNNRNALTELTYIMRLRAGGPTAPRALLMVKPPPTP
jgi:tetratricopeptide (TPR) repeat protein